MPFLSPQDRDVLKKRFSIELKKDVHISFFTQVKGGLIVPGRECPSCNQSQEVLEELAALSPKIHLEVIDFYLQADDAKSRGVERIPAIVMGADGGSNVKYYGIPSGYEFFTMVEDVATLAKAQTYLKLETRKALKKLNQDVHIQVFVTPNCQYCPSMASLAHTMAIESPRVTAEVFEVQEFPSLVQTHHIMGVPKTIINDTVTFTGAIPEELLLRKVLEAVGELPPSQGDSEQASAQTTLLSR